VWRACAKCTTISAYRNYAFSSGIFLYEVKRRITRRAVLTLGFTAIAAAAETAARKRRPPAIRGEFVRFVDPTTEAWVVRLTSTASVSLLPAPQNRFISAKQHFLVFSSNRTGPMTPFHLDLRSAALRPLAETRHLLPHSLCLDQHERLLYFIDNGVLKETMLTGRKTRTIADGVSAFGLGCSGSDSVIARSGRLFRLNITQPLAENVAFGPLVRPDGTGCLFGRDANNGREFWYVAFAPGSKPVLLASGRVSNPFWSPHGESLLFLRDVETKTAVLSEIHESIPETGVERKLDPTSEFAAFAPNSNASVFVGASRSKAQPNILLLLRSVARELTLCEHRSSDPASVSPVFSPDSRQVFFQSDREGKSALYVVDVSNFVEPT
jgi:oligogalacturonide lyase